MDFVSFRSVLVTLSVLSMFVALLTNYWRFGNIDLAGRWANMRGIYLRAAVIGVALAAIMRANILDILQNPERPARLFGWLSFPWRDYATPAEKALGLVDEVVGILVTGIVLAFISKFWNDFFDLVYEFKRWMRGKANSLKPEEGTSRPAPVVHPPRGGRRRRGRRGGEGDYRGGGGGGGGGDYRDRDRGDRGDRGDRDRDRPGG